MIPPQPWPQGEACKNNLLYQSWPIIPLESNISLRRLQCGASLAKPLHVGKGFQPYVSIGPCVGACTAGFPRQMVRVPSKNLPPLRLLLLGDPSGDAAQPGSLPRGDRG